MSGPAITRSTTAASSTVRVIGPAMSARKLSGTTPVRLTKPIVERMPTRLWCDEGPRIEFPVSVPNPTAPKFAATPAAVPPLEPAEALSYWRGVIAAVDRNDDSADRTARGSR